jgi:aspartyl-tRNA(Asn)/glutamyl-tRNA(Gln) amidotransferase subunit C
MLKEYCRGFCITLEVIMEEFEEKELVKLTRLCHIECSEEEKEGLRQKLAKILTYMEQLKEVPTDGVKACQTVLETLTNVMREDEVEETLPRDLFLANAPAHVGGMIRVPPIIKFTNP